ncbi:polyprenol reductase 2-like isoform X1 [Fagus crenata]
MGIAVLFIPAPWNHLNLSSQGGTYMLDLGPYRWKEYLGSLRDRTEQDEEYVIPHGDWFESVSSPHYLAEIVIYAGLLVASGGTDLTIWLLFGFVVANLVFAAAEMHRWYLRKFDNYPSNRLAIIPFLY